MKNLHYRTQSLPEAVYTNHMLHMAHQEYHLQAVNDKLHSTHHSSAIKKRNTLRRSQTNVCDLVPSIAQHRAPLTHGVYEPFLPPPNLNAIGIPVGASNLTQPRSRTQSFYLPNHLRATSLSQQSLHQMGSQHNFCRTDQMIGQYPINHVKALSQRDIGMMNEHKNLSQSWYHRSAPNVSMQSPQSLTTPLFVDCSVEYDLGDHPPVPPNSEPLLSIHPEFVVKSRSVNSSPYSMYQSSNHIRTGKIKGFSPPDKSENHKSLPDIQASYGRRTHQQRYGMARRTNIPRTSPKPSSDPKMEATRKLSIESRDSGIGLMNSGGAVKNPSLVGSTQPWYFSPPSCDTGLGQPEQVEVAPSHPALPRSNDYTNKLLSENNKRFAFTDLVNGLLCCSTPGYAPDLNMSFPEEKMGEWALDRKVGEWSVDRKVENWTLDRFGTPWRDTRTMEWVLASQQRGECRGSNPVQYCGQDCGDGFCYNVWNSMVHV
jgi:hypothetical protein